MRKDLDICWMAVGRVAVCTLAPNTLPEWACTDIAVVTPASHAGTVRGEVAGVVPVPQA